MSDCGNKSAGLSDAEFVPEVCEDRLPYEVNEEHIRTLKNAQTAALSAVTKKRNEVSRLMDCCDNLHLVKSEMENFSVLRSQYDECFMQHMAHLTDSGECMKESKKHSEKTVSIDGFIKYVKEWVMQSELQLAAEFD